MATFAAVVLIVLAVEGVFELARRRHRSEPAWIRNYRHDFFRPGSARYSDLPDAEADRAFIDALVMSHRAPHN